MRRSFWELPTTYYIAAGRGLTLVGSGHIHHAKVDMWRVLKFYRGKRTAMKQNMA
jgi:hypothetical protein